jgi:hypothetical protein
MQLDHILRRLDFSSLSETERKRYINRIHRIVTIIEAQFPHVSQPEQIRLKHCQYFRNVWLSEHSGSESTKAEFLRVLRLLVRVLDRPETWIGALKIKSAAAHGGRPSKIGIKRSKKYYRKRERVHE